jgi:hypothetical protein
MKATMPERQVSETFPTTIGVMSAPLPPTAGPGVMSTSWRPGRGLMEPNPDLPPFDLRRDGVALLWLLALMVAFVVCIGLLAQGSGQSHTSATANAAAHQLTE